MDAERCQQDDDRVVLNVSGRRFVTCASTLASFPDSLLGPMVALDRVSAAVVACIHPHPFFHPSVLSLPLLSLSFLSVSSRISC
jgi:hypothetical protein